jgi:hypothetical protein
VQFLVADNTGVMNVTDSSQVLAMASVEFLYSSLGGAPATAPTNVHAGRSSDVFSMTVATSKYFFSSPVVANVCLHIDEYEDGVFVEAAIIFWKYGDSSLTNGIPSARKKFSHSRV